MTYLFDPEGVAFHDWRLIFDTVDQSDLEPLALGDRCHRIQCRFDRCTQREWLAFGRYITRLESRLIQDVADET